MWFGEKIDVEIDDLNGYEVFRYILNRNYFEVMMFLLNLNLKSESYSYLLVTDNLYMGKDHWR